jgi:hypothetical protein
MNYLKMVRFFFKLIKLRFELIIKQDYSKPINQNEIILAALVQTPRIPPNTRQAYNKNPSISFEAETYTRTRHNILHYAFTS